MGGKSHIYRCILFREFNVDSEKRPWWREQTFQSVCLGQYLCQCCEWVRACLADSSCTAWGSVCSCERGSVALWMGRQNNLQCSHSTLCKPDEMFSPITHLTQHTHVTWFWEMETKYTTCPKGGLWTLPYCSFWNLWVTLSSSAVRNSVFC